ncbi:hypothetical protein SKAU_G00189490 [Synaphobranchus kaupii]|uniref:Uncharacterized protein n=1 Tax=Synaphobranchus kaupii TaxID=118154 RepID=A0A9Q1IX98_SYNKA|nr:hypothetical protein SKAU_G00189490 [Synaphobranchus kaupii]
MYQPYCAIIAPQDCTTSATVFLQTCVVPVGLLENNKAEPGQNLSLLPKPRARCFCRTRVQLDRDSEGANKQED